ncbi:hypothetical protein Tco_1335276 [Tanacetum coccineum]
MYIERRKKVKKEGIGTKEREERKSKGRLGEKGEDRKKQREREKEKEEKKKKREERNKGNRKKDGEGGKREGRKRKGGDEENKRVVDLGWETPSVFRLIPLIHSRQWVAGGDWLLKAVHVRGTGNVQFSENTRILPEVDPIGFLIIDALTKMFMQLLPVVVGTQSIGNACTTCHVMMQSSPDAGFKPLGDDEKNITEEPGKEGGDSSKDSECTLHSDQKRSLGHLFHLQEFPQRSSFKVEQIIRDLNSAPQTRRMTKNLEEHEEPKKVIHALKDPSWIEAMQEELLQFKLQEVWTLVDLPNGKRPIGTKWMDVKSAFLYGKIEEEVYVCQPLGFEDPDFPNRSDKYVTEILKKFGFTDVKTASTPIETQKPLLKDEDSEEVDVYLYKSMIDSLMYLTSLRPDIMFPVCACARYQVNLKIHCRDYAGASLDRKSTTGDLLIKGFDELELELMLLGINLLLLGKVNAARHKITTAGESINLLLLGKVNAARHKLTVAGEVNAARYNVTAVGETYVKIPKLYRAYELCDKNEQLHVFDSEETLEDAEKSQLKMNEFQKDEKIQELKIQPIDYEKLNKLYKDFVPQKERSAEQTYFSSSCISSVSKTSLRNLLLRQKPSDWHLIASAKSNACDLLIQMDKYYRNLLGLLEKNHKRESIFYTSKEEQRYQDLVHNFCMRNRRNKSVHAEIERISKESKLMFHLMSHKGLSKRIVNLEKVFYDYDCCIHEVIPQISFRCYIVIMGVLQMTTLKFVDSHNMVTFFTKSAESEGFEQIVDFLNVSSIRYALTVNPIIYTLCIEQFWATVKAKTVNGEVQLQALEDRKKIIITKSIVKRDLQLEDAEGIDCLSNATIFEQLSLMGYEKLSQKLTFYKAFFSPQWKFLIHTILQCLSVKTTAWNEFSSTMASVIICLAINQKFNFSKYIFESMVKNLDNAGKFLMYPRFLQVFLDNQLEEMATHNRTYVTPCQGGNMRRNIMDIITTQWCQQ